MTDVSKCKKCQFMAVRDDALPPLLFHCPQCSFKSCTECGEEYHPNMQCDQVESKNKTDRRTNVKEAMTLALIRTCPRPFFRKKFLKTNDCNKMTCSCGCAWFATFAGWKFRQLWVTNIFVKRQWLPLRYFIQCICICTTKKRNTHLLLHLPSIVARPHCPHQSCKKCPLWVDTSTADKVKSINAAKEAAKYVLKTAKVDVDSLLKDPRQACVERER